MLKTAKLEVVHFQRKFKFHFPLSMKDTEHEMTSSITSDIITTNEIASIY